MQLNLSNEDIEFLKELGQEMKEQENDCQASPRYWTVGDYEDRLVPDGYGDKTKIFLPDDCETIAIEDCVEFIAQHDVLTDEELRDLSDEYADYDDILEAVQLIDGGANMFQVERTHIIKPNTMFLTKQEAKDHITANHYHYTNEAHTYAMTAWRAPKVKRLFEILEKLGE